MEDIVLSSTIEYFLKKKNGIIEILIEVQASKVCHPAHAEE